MAALITFVEGISGTNGERNASNSDGLCLFRNAIKKPNQVNEEKKTLDNLINQNLVLAGSPSTDFYLLTYLFLIFHSLLDASYFQQGRVCALALANCRSQRGGEQPKCARSSTGAPH